jgi:uncharacterized protein
MSTRPVGAPLAFFLLAAALTVPFLVLGALVDLQVLPGLPLSALMTFVPALAATILVWRSDGAAEAKAFLARAFDWRRIGNKAWLIPVVLIMPGVMVLQYLWMRSAGVVLPPVDVPLWVPPLMLAAFLVAAVGEELGWSGYALGPMQDRWGALRAAVLLGAIWAAWHIIPFVQAGRGAEWIVWKCLGTVATRVIMVWLFNNTGKSVFAMVLFHAMDNVSAFLFPSYGSHLDPEVMAVILVTIALVVAATSDPATLTRTKARGRP